MIIKVCGMRDGENIRQVEALGVDWIGMIFWPKSPRYVTMVPTHAGIIPDRGSLSFSQSDDKDDNQSPVSGPKDAHVIKRVGVFVDDMAQNIITRAVNYQLDLIQLHGHETPTLIRNLRATLDPDLRPGIKFIKAITIPAAEREVCHEAIATYKQYEDCVDYFLFDTRCKTVGGSGEHFDWSVLEAYDGRVPFLLSGGIGPDDAERVRDFFSKGNSSVADRCIGIDLNSRFETEPGMKDVTALRTFLQQL